MYVGSSVRPYQRYYLGPPQMVEGDGLGHLDGFFSSVKSVAGKAAPIALPIAGVVLAPFTGGASLAFATAGTMALQAAKQSKAEKKAKAEEKDAEDEYNEQVQAAVAAGYVETPTGWVMKEEAVASGLQPVQDPQTGKEIYIPGSLVSPSIGMQVPTVIMIVAAGGLLWLFLRK